MQILRIDGMDENSDDLDNYISKIEAFNIEEEILVIIDSQGGSTYIGEFLSRIIPKFNFHLEVYTACSTGLVLLDKIHKEAQSIYVGNSCWAVAHISAYHVAINKGVARGANERYKIDNKDIEEYIPSVLNTEQIKEFNNGEDVYILAKQMREYYSK